jgi:hypothetical protein
MMRFTPPHDLETFTRSPYRVSWIYPAPHLSVYVRKGNHLHPLTKELIKTFDIANVRVDGDKQCNGIFSKWLREVIMEAPQLNYEAIHIENVLTERFAEYFRKDSRWIEVLMLSPCTTPSFFMMLSK